MSSAVCCEGSSRRVSLLLLLSLLCLQLIVSCNAGRINRAAFMDGDVRSEVVDPNNRTIWSMFNLTQEQVDRIQNGSNPTGKDETTQDPRNRLLDQIAVRRWVSVPFNQLPDLNFVENKLYKQQHFHLHFLA